MSITSASLPYPTREISTDFPAFLTEIGAQSVPIIVETNDQTINAVKGNTYQIIGGTGTDVIINDPTTGLIDGDYYKVIIAKNAVVTIGGAGGTFFNDASPLEIIRFYEASSEIWQTVGGLAATQITSGTFDTARIPSLAATQITSGTFDTSRIPSLAASKITSGTFDIARIPDIPLSKIIETSVTSLTGATNSLEKLDINSADYGSGSVISILVDGVLRYYQAQTRAGRVNDLPYLVRPDPAPVSPAPDLIWVLIPAFGAGDSSTSAFANPEFTVSGISTPETTFNTATATVDDVIDVLATLIKTLQTNNVIK